jgi:chemotaxis protein histidine kinase CheA
MLMQSTQNRMARPHLYEQLRNHLLADVYLRRGNAGLYSTGPMGGPLMTPSEQWESFLKLNQKATATSYGVLVNDYLEETNKAPSESDVLALYEEGKDRDSSDQSPEPGFHRRYTAKFEYLVGSYQTFLDEEIAKLKEEDIRAEYERRLKGGDFQLPEESAVANELEAAAAEETTPAETTEEAEATEETEATESSEEMKKDSEEKTEEPKTEEPAEDKKPEEKEEKQAEESVESTDDSDAADADAADADAEDATPEDAGEEDSADQSSYLKSTGVRLVAFQNEDETEGAEDKKEDADSAEEGSEEPKADEKKSDDADGEKSSDKEPEVKEDKKADAEKADDADTEEGDDSKKDDKPKVESFEDVREQIATEMAGPAARQRMDVAVSTINKEMRRYFTLRSIGGENKPEAPDLAEMAREHGFQHEVIGPYDSLTIADEPIANSHDVGTQFGQRGPSFQVMMYGFDNGRTQLPPQVLFSPIRTADDPAGKIYISWKIEETEAYTPSLDEVRDEVVMALRMKEARVLATEAAQAIAKEANESGKSLADLVPEGKTDNIVEIEEPFSWLDSFGFSGATIGNVPQLDSVGTEFMKSVFSTDPGKFSVALNAPQRVVYVVSPKEFKPSIDELQAQFRQPTNRMMAMMVGGSDVGSIVNGFFNAIDEKSGYEKFEDE